MEKKELSQITSMGVSGDYINEVSPLFSIAKDAERGFDFWHKLRRSSLRKYEERYPPDQYKNVLTEENLCRVIRIDEDIEEINRLLAEKSRDSKRYIDLISDIEIQLYGRVRHDDFKLKKP